jgi:hypothetical protein
MKWGTQVTKTKPNYSLVPPKALESIVKVFTYGATKHGDFTFTRDGESLSSQITKAMRHIQEWRMGSVVDDETGESPLAHAAARLVIALSIIAKEDTWSDGPQRNQGTEEGVSQTTSVSDYIQKEVAAWEKATGRDGRRP